MALPFPPEDEAETDEGSVLENSILMREGVRDFRPRRTRGWSTLRR